MKKTILTIGQGEIGAPLTKILQEAQHRVYAKDMEHLQVDHNVDIMIISIPFTNKDSFVEIVCKYAIEYKPELIIINSTVLPGTSKQIADLTNIPTTHSPIMGRHRSSYPEMMQEDIKFYPKFIGADTDLSYEKTAALFNSLGLESRRMSSTTTSELAKLLETTYSGILIGWMQEVERLSRRYGVDWKETLLLPQAANKRIEFQRPTNLFPGFIGGHCIMPNIDLLLQENESEFLSAVVNSNKKKEVEI